MLLPLVITGDVLNHSFLDKNALKTGINGGRELQLAPKRKSFWVHFIEIRVSAGVFTGRTSCLRLSTRERCEGFNREEEIKSAHSSPVCDFVLFGREIKISHLVK